MKHLGISGGGTKIAGLFGVAEALIFEQGYQPDIISGISAGAILAVPLALGKREAIKEIVLNLEQSMFFSNAPVKSNGKLRTFNAISKILGGKHYLGQQDALKKTLAAVVSREDFSRFQHEAGIPVAIVGTVDFYSGKRYYFDLKKVSYEHFLEFVNASASIPIFTEGFRWQGDLIDFEGKSSGYNKFLLFDGGVRDHSPTSKILGSEKYKGKITESATIFSRPDDITDIIAPQNFEPKNLLSILERYVEINNAEVSKNDEILERQLIRDLNITDRGTYFLPRVMQGVYDVDANRLKELYEKGRALVMQA